MDTDHSPSLGLLHIFISNNSYFLVSIFYDSHALSCIVNRFIKLSRQIFFLTDEETSTEITDLPKVTVSDGTLIQIPAIAKAFSSSCITLCLKEVNLILVVSHMRSLQGECPILGVQMEVCYGG